VPAAPLIQQSRLPFVWILRAVEDRIDNDALWLNLIEDHIGESADKGTPVVNKHSRIHQGMSLNGDDRRVNTTQELPTQPETLLLAPSKGVGDILPGRREKVRLFSPSIQGSTS